MACGYSFGSMDYFWIRQDKRHIYGPMITNLRDIVWKREEITAGNGKSIPDISLGFIQDQKEIDFVDILDSQVFLISEGMKEVFELYEPALKVKTVCMLDNLHGRYANYYIPLLAKINCLSRHSLLTPDRSQVKKLVLNAKAQYPYSVFQVAGVGSDVVVARLDVMESLLRRKITDFCYTLVELRDE